MPEGCDVLRPQAHVLGPGGDRLVDLAVLLEGVRELAPRDRAEWALLNLFLGGGDRGAGSTLVAERIAHELTDVEPSGPDAQEDEAAAEDEDEKDERPLRLIAQAREEHRVLRYACGAASGLAAGWASIARLALRAAAVSSCQFIPPFS